ncbi:Uncharacterised protein [Yersinia intermedia]|uniref:Uncharacterized protein n=1 Tax=Yersinia intermedia TaxID=631 RepID=A0A0H5LUY8_YERIN|nr:Uncharacterised protein [Yersinia intermedia]
MTDCSYTTQYIGCPLKANVVSRNSDNSLPATVFLGVADTEKEVY